MQPTFLVEEIDIELMEYEIITEDTTIGKVYTIKGPFIETDIKNKNKRIYPAPVVRPQVEAYQKEIKKSRAVGELEHPNSLEINPKNISHKITKLEFEGKHIVIGEATVCNTPNGMIVKALLDEGIKLGISSRGSGTLKEGIVQKDYRYICNDIVWDPSAPNAFVEAIMEAKTEWVIKNGILIEREIEDFKSRLKNFKGENINKVMVKLFTDAYNRAEEKLHK